MLSKKLSLIAAMLTIIILFTPGISGRLSRDCQMCIESVCVDMCLQDLKVDPPLIVVLTDYLSDKTGGIQFTSRKKVPQPSPTTSTTSPFSNL